MSDTTATLQRLRITYRHGESLRYVGHLDLVRAWERALRRSGAPLAYSEGFNPQARLQFASALPLGATSQAEIVDIVLNKPMTPAAFIAQLQPHLPPGLTLLAAEEAPLKTKALQGLLRASEWQVDVETDLSAAELARRVAQLLAQTTTPVARQRKGRTVTADLRPLILSLFDVGEAQPGWQRLHMTLRSEGAASARPEQVLTALGLAGLAMRMERLRCLFAEEVSERPAQTA
jgi:radical SAM-linked protein